MTSRTKRITIAAIILTSLSILPAAAQDQIIIDASSMTQDDLVFELILDPATYVEKPVLVKDLIYIPFGTKSDQVAFYGCNPWFRDAQTYGFTLSDTMYDYFFSFWFHPDTVDGKRFCMELNGYTYRAPKQVSLAGYFVEHTLNTGKVLNLFIVEQLTIDGETFIGSLPASITN